jgi:hypothetical protein
VVGEHEELTGVRFSVEIETGGGREGGHRRAGPQGGGGEVSSGEVGAEAVVWRLREVQWEEGSTRKGLGEVGAGLEAEVGVEVGVTAMDAAGGAAHHEQGRTGSLYWRAGRRGGGWAGPRRSKLEPLSAGAGDRRTAGSGVQPRRRAVSGIPAVWRWCTGEVGCGVGKGDRAVAAGGWQAAAAASLPDGELVDWLVLARQPAS